MTPANITVSINTIPMLNGSNFKSWKENLEIVLGVMDLDLALREDSPPALTDNSTSKQKREKERLEKSNQNARFFEDGGFVGGDKVKDIIEEEYVDIPMVDIGMMEDDPINFHQAMECSKSQKWIDAINEEIKSMKDNDVSELVQLPQGVKPIGCK
ncbi:UNVERIFIED_CONTAM: hypothetical protein Scaly_1030700 [Sesamum calycinum]|uniref:Retrotransposon Copia-like N-terminal domain-containing protein n=1 Tax=Sesamum calycinum TaxID=2727403 RepID=A0AAW2QJW4_9LAMI